MALRRISDEIDYQTCIRQASLVKNLTKNIICPNFKYVFYTELEINLNYNFTDWLERWCLYFTDISLPPRWNNNDLNVNDCDSVRVFMFPTDQLIIYHNAKMKYRCFDCPNEWTSARGRITFQAEVPRVNKYNFLFVNLCTQQCRLCGREIQPSWYLNEATRIMKHVCRILIERFYAQRHFALPRTPSSSSEEGHIQRRSQTGGHHHRDLCRACRQGYCYDSHRQHQ